MELMRSQMCDKCLALADRYPDTPISEFCDRCQRKLGSDFLGLIEATFPPEPGDTTPLEDWE